ncbi:MAG: GNAT family N-acetyltransferase [Deltaproteobacteria bacterium]|nr:GNAT family N-acetyltransferase [Deltaproteobacteria bacterium]
MVIIRPARQGDIDSLTELLKILFTIEEDFVFDEMRQRRGLQMMLDNDRACILTAEADGQVIGMCSGQLTVSTAEGGPALLVEDVVVRGDWHGRGIGRRLMESLGAWAGEKRVSRLQLLADRNNGPALDFYHKLGWQTTELICLRKRLSR